MLGARTSDQAPSILDMSACAIRRGSKSNVADIPFPVQIGQVVDGLEGISTDSSSDNLTSGKRKKDSRWYRHSQTCWPVKSAPLRFRNTCGPGLTLEKRTYEWLES